MSEAEARERRMVCLRIRMHEEQVVDCSSTTIETIAVGAAVLLHRYFLEGEEGQRVTPLFTDSKATAGKWRNTTRQHRGACKGPNAVWWMRILNYLRKRPGRMVDVQWTKAHPGGAPSDRRHGPQPPTRSGWRCKTHAHASMPRAVLVSIPDASGRKHKEAETVGWPPVETSETGVEDSRREYKHAHVIEQATMVSRLVRESDSEDIKGTCGVLVEWTHLLEHTFCWNAQPCDRSDRTYGDAHEKYSTTGSHNSKSTATP